MPASPLHHPIAPRPLNPAALAAFWISVLFLPGLLLIGILQHVVHDHETQLRHEHRGRLLRELPLFVRDLGPKSYIERYQKKLFPLLDRQGNPEAFLTAWKAATGFEPLRVFHAGADLDAVTVHPMAAREPVSRPPPSRVIAGWLQDLAGMERRARLGGGQQGRGGMLPARTTSKLMLEHFGLHFPTEFTGNTPTALFSTRNNGEILYFTLHLDTVSSTPDAAIRGGSLLVFRDRDISRTRVLQDALHLGRSRGVRRSTRWRPRRYTTLVGSWQPAGAGLAIETPAPSWLFSRSGRTDPERLLLARLEVPHHELVSPLRRYAALLRAIVFGLWVIGAILLLRLRFTGTFGMIPLRSKLVGLLCIAVGLPLVLFLLAALAYGRFSEILGRQERMNKLRQHLEQLERNVQTGSTLFRKQLFEIRDDISRALGHDESIIRRAVENLGNIGIYDFAYYLDNRGRVMKFSFNAREAVYGSIADSKVAQFLHPTAVAMLKARGNLDEANADRLAKRQPPSTAGQAFLRSITQNAMNDFVTTEGKPWDAAMPDLGTQRFQILFPHRYTPSSREDSLIMLLSRPEQEAAAGFDRLFGHAPAAFRDMDGEYETRLAIYQIDKGVVPTLAQEICWPGPARSDTHLTALARRAFENGWTGAVSLHDGSIEAARLFTNTPFIAVGLSSPRGTLAGNALRILFWLLSAYTLALLCLTTYFLSRLFERPLEGLITAVRRLEQGELGLTVGIRSADELGVIGDEITRMSRGLRERNRLRRFVSELAAEAAQSGEEAGSRVHLTILFTHIREFTRLSESLGPTGTVDLLNGYYAAMEAAVQSRGGSIDKFIGDAVMAVFHPDRTGGNHAAAACHAAREMRRALDRFNRLRGTAGEAPIQTGIGIASGIVIAGRVGSSIRRQDFTVIGDTVNLAARLEALAGSGPFGPILLNDTAAAEAGPEFLTIATGRLTVKGKTEPVTVFRLETGDDA